ncbi:L-glutamine ABC transporter membrane protein /L-glutamate ABC transporter membrane protein /L-aspartate ABC transporter membrane protein /L-asparagine ABC transporter membrane protein [Cognatiyoonia sediminum]|uniref:L-glutamine ABC transporter membrane protein /L-glutamate ABC transporter membrane protein /L-aspartate ABC transporter membrane protein /L-asparagine ABC transporter membrane protein n=1 Tax=Cognatiyoonia sediminum TaxID=1508389 RepID=A0A1M5SVM3_9RHOB|nr:ABC transporter permease subunit [Cognatiyoonia sediminum]SHH42602.1 L-glutamine ABC transporter membrane protein /L-glutamate ABC transporter membrane protein /L-aspartate ABC transporter membrane protein /L-asparagine ABC transporter membrane protein [Cognatiyoonia sediminum]
MSTTTDPDTRPDGFRLGMLINDTRYRSYTFQFIALVLLILGLGYLISNLLDNLARAGLNISWAFLGEPAGYDINQRPIEYTSQSTHARASMVGAINTLIVAFLACISATVIGVVAGVLRLSNNWIVSKLMSVYVEAFRNVPVLIWILIIFLAMSNALPQPRTFRGDDATSSMLFDAIAVTNRGVYIPSFVNGAGSLIFWIVVIASIVGVFWYRKYAKKVLYATGRMLPTFLPSLGILIVPGLLAYFILGRPVTLEYPELSGFNFKGGIHLRLSLIALWFALAIYTGAFIAENVRAGIQAVSKGQTEAAGALGLRPGRIMNLVILPQALRVIIPPLISQYLNITKNSSLAIAVGYMDITGTLGGITLNQTGRAIEAILLLMLFYLVVSLSISAIMNVYNNRMKLQER